MFNIHGRNHELPTDKASELAFAAIKRSELVRVATSNIFNALPDFAQPINVSESRPVEKAQVISQSSPEDLTVQDPYTLSGAREAVRQAQPIAHEITDNIINMPDRYINQDVTNRDLYEKDAA